MENFEELGGFPMLRKISKIFYDKIYAHPWIGKYFENIRQEHIENQQVDFMAQVLGGPQMYFGAFVPDAHKHMMITEELFELRELLLLESFKEAQASPALQERWLKVDRAFKKSVVKKSFEDCAKRFNTDDILDFSNPDKDKKAA